MKAWKVSVSDEYLDDLCDDLEKWCELPKSMVITQFLQHRGIGYPYFRHFVQTNQRVAHTFEFVKAVLCNRWVEKAIDEKDMPAHLAKVLMRYLRLYDGHGLDIEKEMKAQEVEASTTAQMNFIAENYAREKLDGVNRTEYERNVNKRGSGKAP